LTLAAALGHLNRRTASWDGYPMTDRVRQTD